MAGRHCLIVTHLSFIGLEGRISGTYRRLETIVAAAREAGAELTIYSMVSPEEVSGSLDLTAERAQAELQRCWNLRAKVVVGQRRTFSARLPWLFHQAAGITSYARLPAIRMLLPVDMAPTLERLLAERPAFVIAHRLPAMDALTRLRRPLPPTFFDLDDVEHLVVLRGLHRTGSVRESLFNALSLPALIHAERRAVRRASRTFVCSPEDAARVSRFHGTGSVEVLPNVVTMPTPVPPGTGHVMLMVGLFSYGPNADGADWFISQVFPTIRARVPDAELWLAGKAPESVHASAHPPAGVKFLGYVVDLESLHRQSRLVICPIRFGGGTRIKLVEAAAYGKAIVSTALGAEGLGMTSGVDAVLADGAEAFAEACIRVLSENDLCRRLESAARQLAERRFDRNAVVHRLAATFASHLRAHAGSACIEPVSTGSGPAPQP